MLLFQLYYSYVQRFLEPVLADFFECYNQLQQLRTPAVASILVTYLAPFLAVKTDLHKFRIGNIDPKDSHITTTAVDNHASIARTRLYSYFTVPLWIRKAFVMLQSTCNRIEWVIFCCSVSICCVSRIFLPSSFLVSGAWA